ncbi:hypothetical protein J2I47_19365 [Fibrella sp. HMF5335]|uniref:Uncharacterized protein n=1 Tax=Fibrella rubiginis TaxID=2817060 RepID=A0A939GGS5_9BACT|nr:hypothetical protein [Fibrella rubiginis]MBO0938719.1 hypothetical protein [Fibrella rubiginis]
MKQILNLLAGITLFAVSLAANAQSAVGDETVKLRNDPTYSTRNYKQANKAATARSWEGSSGLEVRPPYAPANRLSSYKNQSPGQIPSGGITVEHTPNEKLANRNYKAQQGAPVSEATTTTARKRTKSNAPDNTTAE